MHEELKEAEAVSALAGEGAEEVEASHEAVAAALHREEEAVRGVDSHGDVGDHLKIGATSCS